MAEKELFEDGNAPYIVSAELRDNVSTESGQVKRGQLKTAKDGSTVLIPQPSDDPNDPLNWSWLKKHAVLLTLLPGCFLTDGILTYGSSVFQEQAAYWQMTPLQVSQSISGGVFMQGPGGLLAVAFCQRFGRLPVLFWSQFLSLIVTIGAAGASNYAGFTACRTLQGFFAAAPQVIGLSMIHDMFFFHERARKINIWAFCFLVGPYLLPFISAFLELALTWRNNFWVEVGLCGFSVLTIVLLGDETLYDRDVSNSHNTDRGAAHKIKHLTGIAGFKATANRPSVWTTQKDQYTIILKPYVFLPCFGFIMPLTMWTIGLVNTVSQFVLPPPQAHPPGYGFKPVGFALLFFAPMIGSVLAEAFGHIQNDLIANTYIRRHAGKFIPEVRFWGVYFPWIISVAGLVLYGETLEHHLSWVGLAFGWGMQCFGTLGTTTAISAYLLDVLPKHASLVAAWILQARVLGGFTVTYFQLPWVERNGPAVTFGVQAAIIAAAVASVVATQVFGGRWRGRFPPPAPEN